MQELIDAIKYPPSHQYILEPLEPTGILKERLERMPKHFFKGDSFLDIGCNKGFFTLYADCSYVESIDSIKRYTDLCSKLSKGKVINTSFRNYNPTRQFDRIFIGNTHHYIYKECGGWEWINKLAAISNGLVLIEGPTGLDNSVANLMFEGKLRDEFTYEKFINEMNKHFVLISKVESPASTVNRHIMLFERKSVKKIQKNDLVFEDTIRNNENTNVIRTRDGKVAKFPKEKTDDLLIRIRIASYSPISNGLVSEVYENKEFVGWLEEFNPSRCIYRESEKEIFKLICKHNIYLSKIGYTDTDTATSNFFRDSNKLFDKNQVFHISNIPKLFLEGMYMSQFKNSYATISGIESLNQAIQSKNSRTIERAYNTSLVNNS